MAERIGLSAEMDTTSFDRGVKDYVSGAQKMESVSSTVTKSVNDSFKNLSPVLSSALGIFSGIMATKVVSGLVNMGKAAFEAVSAQERMGMSLQSLLAKEMKAASGTERIITVGQQVTQMTQKQEDAANKLNLTRTKDIANLDVLEEKYAAATKAGKLSAAEMRQKALAITDLKLKINESAAAEGALWDAQGKSIPITQKIIEGQLSMTDAMVKAKDPAAELLRWVERLGAESPFESKDIASALQMSMGFGLTSVKAKDLVTDLVDFAAATGKGTDVVVRASQALGKMNATGKLSGEVVMQLTEAGVPVAETLKEMGVAMDEVGKSGVTADAFMAVFSKNMKSSYGGAAKAQAMSLAGLSSTLKELQQILSRNLFGGVFRAIQPYMAEVVTLLGSDSILNAATAMGESVGAAMATVAKKISDGVKALQVKIKDLQEAWTAGTAQGGLSGGVVSVLAMLGLPSDVTGAIFRAIKPVEEALKGAWETIINLPKTWAGGVAANGTTGGIYAVMNALGFSPEAIVWVNAQVANLRTTLEQAQKVVTDEIAKIKLAFSMGNLMGGQGGLSVLATLMAQMGFSPEAIATVTGTLAKAGRDVKAAFASVKLAFTTAVSDIQAGVSAKNILWNILLNLGMSGEGSKKVMDTLKGIEKDVKAGFDKVKTAFNGAVTDVKNGVPAEDILLKILTALGLGAGAATALSRYFGEIVRFWTDEFDRFKTAVENTIKAVRAGDWDAVWGIWKTALVDSFKAKLILVANLAGIIWEELKKIPEAVGRLLDSAAVTFGPQFTVWLEKSLDKLSESLPTLGMRFSALITNMLKETKKQRVIVEDEDSHELAVVGPGSFQSLIEKTFSKLWVWGNTEAPVLAEQMGIMLGSVIRGAVILLVKIVKELAVGLWNVIIGAAKESTNDERKKESTDLYHNFLKGVWEGLTGREWVELDALVKAWVHGLVLGLGYWEDWLITSVTNWAKNAILKPIQDVFDSHSPSKVMMELGLDIMKGLAIGLDEGTVEVVTKVSNIAQAIAGTFNALVGAMTTLGDASGLAMPDVAEWLVKLKSIITLTVNAIVELAGPGNDFAFAVGQAAGVIPELMTVLNILQTDLSKLATTSKLPDMELWVEQMTEVITAIVGLVGTTLGTISLPEIVTMSGVVQALGGIMQLIGVDLAVLNVPAKLPNLDLWGTQMVAVFAKIREVVGAIIAQPAIEKTGGKFPETVAAITSIMSLISVDLSGGSAMLRGFDLELWGRQMVQVFDVIRKVVRDIRAQDPIEKTGGQFPETVAAIVAIMGLLNVDLSKASTLLKGFDSGLWRRQMVQMFEVIRLVVRDIRAQDPIEKTGGQFPETVAAIVAIMNLLSVDLSRATNLLEGFDVTLWQRQMVLVFSAIREVVKAIGLLFGLADLDLMSEQVAKIVQIFGLVMIDLSKMAVAKDLPDVWRWVDQITLVFGAVRLAVVKIVDAAAMAGDDLEQMSLDVARIVQIFGLVAIDLSKMAVVKNLPDIWRWVDQITLVFGAIRLAVVKIVDAAAMAGDDLEQMSADVARIVQIFGLVAVDLSKLSTEFDLTGLGLWGDALVVVFAELKRVITAIIATGGDLEALATAAGNITAIVNLVKPAVDAIAAMTEYVNVDSLFTAMANMADRVGEIVKAIGTLAKSFTNADALATVVVFAQQAGTIVGLIKPALDAIQAMTEYKDVGSIQLAMKNMAERLDDIVTEIIYIAGFYTDPIALGAAAAFATAAGTIVGLIGPAIAAIGAMTVYADAGSVQDAMVDLGDRLIEIVDEIGEVAEYYNLEGLGQVALFSTAAGTIIKVVSDTIVALKALAEYGLISSVAGRMDQLMGNLREILTKITTLAATPAFSPTALAGAVVFGGQVGTITSSLATAITSIEAIANYRPSVDIAAGLRDFVGRCSALLTAVSGLKAQYDPDGLLASSAFLLAVQGVTRNVILAMDGVNEVAIYPFTWGLDYNMGQFEGYVTRMITTLRNMTFIFAPVAVMSENMASDVRILIGNWNEALRLIGSMTAPTLALPTFAQDMATAIEMAKNEVVSHMPGLVDALRGFIPSTALAGYDLANAFTAGVSQGLSPVSAGGGAGLQSVSAGGNSAMTLNLTMNNNVANGLDVGLLNAQIRQTVTQAIGRG